MTHIFVVDDDSANLQIAGRILSRNNMRVTALKSGKALLERIGGGESPDLILLDIMMPEMDGFETLKLLREKEKELGREAIPVVFLTASEDKDTEREGFHAGVSDFVRKPFDPDILISRIDSILIRQQRLMQFKSEASTDMLTGLLNKTATNIELTKVCLTKQGCLMMIDLDSFKLVNDIYGHDMGDEVLKAFANILTSDMPAGSVIGRVGGDEFVAFSMNTYDPSEVTSFSERINAEIVAKAKELMGANMEIPLGVSLGGVFVPRQGNDFESLLRCADKALYDVKKNGKHGGKIYHVDMMEEDGDEGLNIDMLSEILGERSIPNVALQLDKGAFSYVYRYVMRYIVRNQRSACKVLFTLQVMEGTDPEVFRDECDEFGNHVSGFFRKSDILTRSRSNQYFVFLTDIKETSISKVLGNVIGKWYESHPEHITISYETEFIGGEFELGSENKEKKIVVVDDDSSILQLAGHTLSKAGYYVSALRSGQALLKYLEENVPDLILLDVKMPDMDGFETLQKLRNMERVVANIPVVYLTSDESIETEKQGLSLGAMDFIKKPFVPEVFILRVRHILELEALQKHLSSRVEQKTEENQRLFVHVVQSLAEAIDAKDTYTNGHSGRVAEYAREIARRAGYSAEEQNDIYMMGLLHDVGKIGVPDAVINKPAKLNEEEFELIKNHPVMGARILKNIKEKSKLATGARWHHERYDGTGYPDGLHGDDIPEEARIIAVADAYDAMSSRRSYRDVLSQSTVRSEIEKGRGSQFDPKYADIMLEMMDEDTEYKMKES